MKNKYITLLLMAVVWFAGSCKPKPGPEPVDPPKGPTPVVGCSPAPDLDQRRARTLRAAWYLLQGKGDVREADIATIVPTLVLLPERAGGSVSLDLLVDNHVCQLEQKGPLFLSTKEGGEEGTKYTYTTDLGDKITVGLLKGEKWRLYVIILPKGATSSFKFVWQQK